VQTWYGPADGGVGAPCVTWVLDERHVVGDNNRDLGVPRGAWEARSRRCYKAVQPEGWRARAWRELTAVEPVMLAWAVPAVVADSDQADDGMA
jgi:hypothetical protein